MKQKRWKKEVIITHKCVIMKLPTIQIDKINGGETQ